MGLWETRANTLAVLLCLAFFSTLQSHCSLESFNGLSALCLYLILSDSLQSCRIAPLFKTLQYLPIALTTKPNSYRATTPYVVCPV